jgi:hypothetical protein
MMIACVSKALVSKRCARIAKDFLYINKQYDISSIFIYLRILQNKRTLKVM